ncbi:hypothetical protein [Klebsiella pneumoniae]|uniref:hypothetical protein n=1 Tax=Klebsiella pneumoniae TaxID=573 RepID=UPI003464B889
MARLLSHRCVHYWWCYVGCDPLLYQYVDGGRLFLPRTGKPSKTDCGWCGISMPSATVDHHDDEFIRRCERVSSPVLS